MRRPDLFAAAAVAMCLAQARPASADFELGPEWDDPTARLFTLYQAGPAVDVGSNRIRASSRGTYLYGKGGFGLGRPGDITLGNVSAFDLGFENVQRDITVPDPNNPGQTITLLNQFLLEFSFSPTTVTFEEGLSPMAGLGLGVDLSLGGFLGNRLRPRLEAEYVFNALGYNNAVAPIFQRGFVRNPDGTPLVVNGNLVPDTPVEVDQQLGESDLFTHALMVNAILTAELYPRVRPYVGGGAGVVFGSFTVGEFQESDFTTQLQFLGGVIFSISEEFELDVGVRYSTAGFDFAGREIDADVVGGMIAVNFRL